MDAAATDEFPHVKRAMRAFLVGDLTGCRFAHALSRQKDDPIAWFVIPGTTFEADVVQQLDSLLDVAADTHVPGILIFPELRTASEIGMLIQTLADGGRWKVGKRLWNEYARDGELISIGWQTSHGMSSSVMGMAPLGTMPVHRRAPYVALVLWPGRHENRFQRPKSAKAGTRVSLIDMPPPKEITDRAGYRKMWDQTTELTQARRAMPMEGAARHDVAFCLPRDCVSES